MGHKIAVFLLLITFQSVFANSLQSERPYEPVVLNAYKLSQLAGTPVDEMFLYSYNATSQAWTMMPFQIDEMSFLFDPVRTDTVWSYFVMPGSNLTQHDGIFNKRDELVFMIRDLGDKAPERSFIDNAEAATHSRIEINVTDPLQPDKKAYAYVFRSSTIADAVPTPYGFSYDDEQDMITTNTYSLGINEHGTVEDIKILEPGGNGQDILDMLKVRFNGIVDFIFPIPIQLDENYLVLLEDRFVTQNPVVRFIRLAYMTLSIEGFTFDAITFPVRTKFYPYNGTIKGGTSLWPDDLKTYYNGIEVIVILKDMRESWDFNVNATGMKFYNKYNDGILIDGVPDTPDTTVDVPINAWDLTTGDQGSLFKVGHFKEQKWLGVGLYYYDNSEGGQGDSDLFGENDSGDGKSYGDNGILFRNKPEGDSITIELDYTAYFIPEKNLDKAYGEKLAGQLEQPVTVQTELVTDVDGENNPLATSFQLHQNYPNPFNSSTKISFSITKPQKVTISIVNTRGQTIQILADKQYNAGQFVVHWNGRDIQGRDVPSGLYLYKITSGTYEQTKKMLYIK